MTIEQQNNNQESNPVNSSLSIEKKTSQRDDFNQKTPVVCRG